MKVLIVEDEAIARRILAARLAKWGYDVMAASDGSAAWEIVQQNQQVPNLVISDWMMPEMDGLELCRKIRGLDSPGYAYFILLSAKRERENVIQGLEIGADDYLTKPIDWEELRCGIKIGERIVRMRDRILELAMKDHLTGVLNRGAFMDRLETELHRTDREQTSTALVLIDIDYFKNINDTFGHQVGDQVLKQFATVLSGSVRAYDFVGRYGGEEFVICLPGADEFVARSVLRRVKTRIKKTIVVLADGPSALPVTASFGVACSSPGSRETLDALIRKADQAMYRAKQGGRNRICVAEDDNRAQEPLLRSVLVASN